MNRRERDLSNEQSELENEGRRIENARQFVALARDLEYSRGEIRAMVGFVDDRQEIIIEATEADRITGIRLLPRARAEREE